MRKVSGVIGWPVKHSLSPKLHRYWLDFYGIDGNYLAQAVSHEDLAATIKRLPEKGWRGCNLTLPHKEAALALVDSLDETAKAVGAVNTIVINAGKLHGSNTDAYGFIENIRPSMPKKKNKAVVLGAGGAAKAVIYALIREGFRRVVVVNRTYVRTQPLREQFGETVIGEPWESYGKSLEDVDVLVNATSLGMTGKELLDIDLSLLPQDALVTDVVYAPLVTPLLQQAKSRGNPVVDGLGMLLHQAVPGFEAWFGIRPEVTEQLRKHMLQ